MFIKGNIMSHKSTFFLFNNTGESLKQLVFSSTLLVETSRTMVFKLVAEVNIPYNFCNQHFGENKLQHIIIKPQINTRSN